MSTAVHLHEPRAMQTAFSRSSPAFLAIGLFSVAVGATVIAQAPAPSRSVRDGVFTAVQANRGGALYEEKCTSCHAARMWGQEWPEKSVWELYDLIRNFMPEDSPGSLSPQQTRDVVAYILKTNKLPAGRTDLPESDEALKQIRMALP
jgi:cytochrome c